MNILYTCDDNYVWQMGISLISLFENNKDSKIIIYLIHSNVTQSNQKKLIEIVNKYNKSIVFLSLDEINICPLLKENGRWPLVCYARLFFHHVIKDCDRLLYLDCDTLVLSNIEELFSDRYSKFAIYGAKDFIANFYKKLIGMPVEASNINGGVLLFNLKLYCELSPDSRIFSFITKYGNRISYADQDVINGTFWNEFGFLEAKYNVMSIMRCFNYSEIIKLKHPRGGYSEQEVNKAISYPCIIHFTGNYRYTRPWIHNSNHPYKDYFELYKKISPWSDMPMMKILSEKSEVTIAKTIRKLPEWLSCNLLGFFLLLCETFKNMDTVICKIKVSLIVPVYNVEKYLEKCVQSIVRQSHDNIEIILIDDGSTDSSGVMCDYFANLDQRVKVLHKKNGGLSSARNMGIKYSTGSYIAFVDSDDYISPNFVECSLELCKKHNAQISILKMLSVQEDYNSYDINKVESSILMSSEDAIKESLLQKKFSCSASGKLFKRNIVEDVLFPEKKLSEDLAVCHVFFDKADRIIFSNQIGYYYRQRAGSIMHKFNINRLDALYWANNLELYCIKNYPKLVTVSKCRTFNVAINLLLALPKEDVNNSPAYFRILNDVKRCRRYLWITTESRIKDKLAALLSLFGPKLLRFVWFINIAIRSGK